VELGLAPDLYWRSTPRMLAALTAAAQCRLDARHNELAWLAWNAAALQRAKRLPPLSGLLIKRRRAQTWRDQMDIARILTLANGGTVH
jgi:hypothetical protein